MHTFSYEMHFFFPEIYVLKVVCYNWHSSATYWKSYFTTDTERLLVPPNLDQCIVVLDFKWKWKNLILIDKDSSPLEDRTLFDVLAYNIRKSQSTKV